MSRTMVRTHLPRLIVIQIHYVFPALISCMALFPVEMKMTWRWHRGDCNTIVVAKVCWTPWIKISISKKNSTESRENMLNKHSSKLSLGSPYLCFFPFKSPTEFFVAFNKGQKVAFYLFKKTRGWKHSIGVLQNSPSSAGLRTST